MPRVGGRIYRNDPLCVVSGDPGLMNKSGLSRENGCKRTGSQPEGARIVIDANLVKSIQATKLGISQKHSILVCFLVRRA